FASGEATGGRLLALTAVPVADAAGRRLGVLVFLEDRTATKRLERELSARRELAALGEMSAGIAHEFRNATATILGFVRLAASAESPEARARHLSAIRREAEHVARITGDFLLFARPERVERAETDLDALVAEAVRDERVVLPGVTVEVEGAFGTAWGDAALLRRALVNLVRNAAEAASGGGGTRVLVSGERGEDAVRVRVEDDGPGIAEAEAEKVFVPFFSTKEGGTGLGLALVAKIATLHGGTVSVERSPALGGARFVLALPVAAP
ncbi:MAG: two-component system sensor histidine kinase AtoS, partial [Acidobacteria bacterium ACB2]|nr:two-component system sensor histidine kinase AtoS [Acidobacteria bacterium ACB2]